MPKSKNNRTPSKNLEIPTNENLHEFVESMFLSEWEKYKSATWLKNDFKEMVWLCDFGYSGTFTIDFQNLIKNEIAQENLVSLLKHWLISASGDSKGVLGNSLTIQYRQVKATCAFIDYLILNEEWFEFKKCGLSLVTPDALKGIHSEIFAFTHNATTIYSWENRVIDLCTNGLKNSYQPELDEIITANPIIKKGLENSWPRRIDEATLVNMRAWLHKNGYLKWETRNRYTLDAKKISKEIYKNTLQGMYISPPRIPQFSNHKVGTKRRGKRVDETSQNIKENCSASRKASYVAVVQRLKPLYSFNSFVQHLPPFSTIEYVESMQTEFGVSRFESLPNDVVFKMLRGSIEFIDNYGHAIVNSYERLIEYATALNTSISKLDKNTFKSALDKKLLKLNIDSWSNRSGKPSLHQFITILLGATMIIIGTLMARRQDELVKLEAADCLDKTKQYLNFKKAKSGVHISGLRQTELRPIIRIGVHAVEIAQRIQNITPNFINDNEPRKLFACPSLNKNTSCQANHKTYNKCLDAVCDYIQLDEPKDNRIYFRQHQLRRFFAMVFFWHSKFNNIDTLRWFLGHKDLESVYRYITETTPGTVLNRLKANHISADITAHEELSCYIKETYGTSKFALMSERELEDYTYMLIEDEKISVEPVFFKGPDGQDYKILVRVTENGPKN